MLLNKYANNTSSQTKKTNSEPRYVINKYKNSL